MPRVTYTVTTITKRDGSRAPFDNKKIEIAVEKAMRAAGELTTEGPGRIAKAITKTLAHRQHLRRDFVPSRSRRNDIAVATIADSTSVRWSRDGSQKKAPAKCG